MGSRDTGRGEAHIAATGRGEACLSLVGDPNLVSGAWGPPHSPLPESKVPAPLQSDVSATCSLEQVPIVQGRGWREAAGISQEPRPSQRSQSRFPRGPKVEAGWKPTPLPLRRLALAPRPRGKTSSPQPAPRDGGPSAGGRPRASCPARGRSCPEPPQRKAQVPSPALVRAVSPPLCSPLPGAPLGDFHAQR